MSKFKHHHTYFDPSKYYIGNPYLMLNSICGCTKAWTKAKHLWYVKIFREFSYKYQFSFLCFLGSWHAIFHGWWQDRWRRCGSKHDPMASCTPFWKFPILRWYCFGCLHSSICRSLLNQYWPFNQSWVIDQDFWRTGLYFDLIQYVK